MSLLIFLEVCEVKGWQQILGVACWVQLSTPSSQVTVEDRSRLNRDEVLQQVCVGLSFTPSFSSLPSPSPRPGQRSPFPEILTFQDSHISSQRISSLQTLRWLNLQTRNISTVTFEGLHSLWLWHSHVYPLIHWLSECT